MIMDEERVKFLARKEARTMFETMLGRVENAVDTIDTHREKTGGEKVSAKELLKVIRTTQEQYNGFKY